MDNLLNNLNPEQLQAVAHQDGPLLIVAGAGTGKTTVIARRFAYLIEHGLAKPDEILALTFTEKAAMEMEERVEQLLPFGYFDLWISTFHGFCERLLKEHGLAIGLPGDFKLLNEFEQWALVKKNLEKFDLDYYRPLGNPTKFIHSLIKHFSRAKDEDISPRQYLDYAEELLENFDQKLSGAKLKKRGNFQFPISNFQTNSKSKIPNNEIEAQEAERINEVANAYHVYQQLLLDNNALDFGDLINFTLKLFRERPAILDKYRRQFKYILVDEFQDTNWAQYEMVKILAALNNNLAVVGDDDQSIYKFRGASLSNILQFKSDYPSASEIILTDNYRSCQNILDLSYEFIKLNNPNRLEWRLNESKQSVAGNRKLDKKLIARNSGAGKVEVIQGQDLGGEVKRVIDKIYELKLADKSATWNDFAILVRANDSAKEFVAELERRGLPYIFWASRGLYAKPLIMDVIAYLKLLDDYHESAALYRVLNLPIFKFTYQELVNLNHLARKKTWSLYEVLANIAVFKVRPELQAKVGQVLALVSKHTGLVKEKSASEVFMAFMNDSGYLKYLTGQTEQKSLEAAGLLNKFLKRMKNFEAASDDRSVKAFLAELKMEMDAGEEGSLSPDLDAGPEAIKIMTVHAAKGLEFKFVFIANLVDKRFPTIERSEAIALPDTLVKEIIPEGDIHLEEERRLFYVAMTRAKSGLYLSWAEDYGGARKKKPSRFLAETGLVNPETGKRKRESGIGNIETDISEFSQLKPPSHNQSKPSRFPNSQFQLPGHFSYSQLAAYSNCPYQYRFAHILKIPVTGKEQFSFGKTLHLTLQKLFALLNERKGLGQANLFDRPVNSLDPGAGGINITFDEILKLYEQSWLDEWYETKESKKKRRQQGEEILKVFYEKHKNNWPEAIFLEKSFNLRLGENKEYYTIRGTIDRIDKVGEKIRIVDYKTGQPKEKLAFDDKEQLLLYQLAAEELYRQEVGSLCYYYLDNNSQAEFLGTKDELLKVKNKILNTINKIKAGEFPPLPGVLCKFCDFFNICNFRQAR